MKRMTTILGGIMAVAVMLLFAQCTEKQTTTTTQNASVNNTGTCDLKIAYVEIDSLLTQYNFSNDLNEMMLKKEENIRATLNEKARELENEAREFQRKLQNNAFATQQRAEQENARLIKKEQDLQELQNRLTSELAAENQKNSIQLRDSIKSFLKIYNKEKGYSMILSNTGLDNLLYADQAYNITKEIVEGLNKRYTPANGNKK